MNNSKIPAKIKYKVNSITICFISHSCDPILHNNFFLFIYLFLALNKQNTHFVETTCTV